jgi:hypothetical protein
MTVKVDARWCDGSFYGKLGFSFARRDPPNCWVFSLKSKNLELEKTFLKRVRKASSKSLGLVPKQFETPSHEQEEDCLRIFDCGYYVFAKEIADRRQNAPA